MQYKRGENGYALIIVLLLIVFISIVSAVFMRGSLSNAKQEAVVDSNNLAIVAAEMGIEYYRNNLLNAFNNNINDYLMETQAEIEHLYLNQDSVSEDKLDSIYSLLVDKVATLLRSSQGNPNQSVDDSADLRFERTEFIVLPDENSVSVSGEVTGIKGDSVFRDLSMSMTFYIPELTFKDPTDDSPGSGGSDKDDGAIPTPPNNDVKKVYGDYKIMNGPYKQQEGSLHVKGNLTVEPGNNKNGTNINLSKDLYVDKILEFQNHACVTIQGNFTVLNKINLGNKAFFFVYGDAFLPKSVSIHNNSKIYVTGNVYIEGILQKPKPLQYPSVPKTNSSCTLPGAGKPDDSGKEKDPLAVPKFEEIWSTPDLEVEYLPNKLNKKWR
ncbi:hypothetical protein OXB_3123 [Bacillus sp. OxB-1]|uniref:hypothetical protein n=1 Tax=Bacillus sp. (strain OxB-1) TaxID=98228 RepID=UPI0005820F15|nr:hypothetical protein [Bacillus sp. OxB-1]BAQ11592.1 hypothetical protein OXB_3123 [Bacillus sp. OxB-1]